jgi:outer membrane autotransporter protein
VIAGPTLAVSPGSLSNGTGGTPYSQTLTASGGTGPYTFAITAGALPTGLSLLGDAISGTPTATGTFNFTVAATDALGFEGSQAYTVVISAPAIAVTPSTLPAGNVAVAYSQTLTASGGSPTYAFAVTAGALPAGLTLTSAGVLSGTPTAAGSFDFTITATDTLGFTGTQVYTLAISANFVQQRTREVIGNFIAHRADALTSNEPSRFRTNRGTGTLFGGGGETNTASAGGQPGGPPVAFSATPDQNGNLNRLAFGTSLKHMLAAKKQPQATEGGGDNTATLEGRMALGATLANEPPALANAPFDMWVEGYATRFEDDTSGSSGSVGIMYVGADYQIMPGLMIGALMQFDFADEVSGPLGSNVEGNGWMAGPYMSARLTDNLFFDARAAWGRSDNSISPFGTYTDNTDGERWMARAGLTGEWRSDRWRFSPTIGVAYFNEDIESYTDSNGIFIAGQSYSLGRLNFGPEIGYSIPLADGSILEPLVNVQGLWDFDGANPITFNEVPGTTSDLRARVQAGVTLTAPWGYSIRATGMYDGLGSDDYEAYGGQLMVDMPLN